MTFLSKFDFRNLIVHKFRRNEFACRTKNNFIRNFFSLFHFKRFINKLNDWIKDFYLRNLDFEHRFFSKIELYVRKIAFFRNSQFFWFWFENIFSSFLFIDDEFSITFRAVFDAEKSAFFNSSKSNQKRRKRQKFLKFSRYFSFFNRALFTRVHFDLLSAQR